MNELLVLKLFKLSNGDIIFCRIPKAVTDSVLCARVILEYEGEVVQT